MRIDRYKARTMTISAKLTAAEKDAGVLVGQVNALHELCGEYDLRIAGLVTQTANQVAESR